MRGGKLHGNVSSCAGIFDNLWGLGTRKRIDVPARQATQPSGMDYWSP